ncbi:hypothetical protein EVB87_213 [Rhizobium phage RHph_N28_1]|nr:hypothetical protein EVB87_213 [Rhizobium phage RHph_N28_1]QIG74242.1 hypothetical protein EVC07_214 [Rhizobium phage RHph_N42]
MASKPKALHKRVVDTAASTQNAKKVNGPLPKPHPTIKAVETTSVAAAESPKPAAASIDKPPATPANDTGVIVTNYEQLRKAAAAAGDLETAIIDESHMVKEPAADEDDGEEDPFDTADGTAAEYGEAEELEPHEERSPAFGGEDGAGDMFHDADSDANDNGDTTNIEISAYVSPEDEAAEELDAILNPGDETPDLDFMISYLTSHEKDDAKREQFFAYIHSLDPLAQRALWEAFKGSYGSNVSTIEALDTAASLIKQVEESRSLKVRDAAMHSELARMGTVYAQIARALRIDVNDTVIGSMRVDNISKTLAKAQRDLHLINAAVLEMAQMLMVGEKENVADMAINPERAVKLCSIIGYSAKAWANVYEHANKERSKFAAEIEALKTAVKDANERATTAQAHLDAERKRIEALTVSAGCYVIGNLSGNYITTANARTEENAEYFRVTPYNVRITPNRDEALEFDDIEVARKMYDAVQEWGAKNVGVRKMLAAAGVQATTLFISTQTVVKVS